MLCVLVFTNNIKSEKISMFTHCSRSLLGAGPLVSGLDGHPVACSRGIQGVELSRRTEVQRGLDNRSIGGDRKRQRE